MTQEELEALSDFEINMLIAKLLHPNAEVKSWDDKYSPSAVMAVSYREEIQEYCHRPYNYCECPIDIMPIAIENKIDLQFRDHPSLFPQAICGQVASTHKNIYRAICIVYLLMQGDKDGY